MAAPVTSHINPIFYTLQTNFLAVPLVVTTPQASCAVLFGIICNPELLLPFLISDWHHSEVDPNPEKVGGHVSRQILISKHQ